MKLIQAAQKDDALLHDIRGARADQSTLNLWWLGQSGFLLGWNNHFLLFDPYLSDSLTEKYAATDQPHIRLTERCIAPEKLDFLEVVSSSHNHTDHLDAATLTPLFAVNPDLQMVVPSANRAFVSERLKRDQSTLSGINDGESAAVGCWEFHGIAAAHNVLETDENGQHKFLGYVVKFGPFCVYHSGDCLPYKGLEERLQTFDIDIALLPINGNRPERRVAGNFDGREAARLAHSIGAKLVVPCHYDLFEFNTASPDEFVEECQKLNQKYFVLRCGERLTIAAD